MSTLITNPVELRNKLIFWAIENELINLADTFQSGFLDKIFEANLKPDAVTSEDLMALIFNPRKTICEADLATRLFVSEALTQKEIQVRKWFPKSKSTFLPLYIFFVPCPLGCFKAIMWTGIQRHSKTFIVGFRIYRLERYRIPSKQLHLTQFQWPN